MCLCFPIFSSAFVFALAAKLLSAQVDVLSSLERLVKDAKQRTASQPADEDFLVSNDEASVPFKEALTSCTTSLIPRLVLVVNLGFSRCYW